MSVIGTRAAPKAALHWPADPSNGVGGDGVDEDRGLTQPDAAPRPAFSASFWLCEG